MGFASDTSVEAIGGGRYSTQICAGWDIGGKANGGYLLSIADAGDGRRRRTPGPGDGDRSLPRTGLTRQRRGDDGGGKVGRTFTTVTGALESGGRRLLQVVGTFGDVSDAAGPERVDAEPPALPPPDECIRVEPTDTFPPPFMGRVDLRLHPEDAGFSSGSPSGEPRVRGWFRLRDEEPVDSIGLVLATDAFPPTAFNARLPVAWTPTVELTAHVRARPAPGWLRCVFTTRFVTGGFLEEDGEIWDGTGHLVAQSRQLALVPRDSSDS